MVQSNRSCIRLTFSLTVPFPVVFLLAFGAESLLQSNESSELKSSSSSLYLEREVISMLAMVGVDCNDVIKLEQSDDKKNKEQT